MRRIDWHQVVDLARGHVHTETTALGVAPSLRRVHYLLASDEAARGHGYANTASAYKVLSRKLVAARQAGAFPDLSDHTRSVSPPFAFTSEQDGRQWLAEAFALDRRPYSRQRVLVAVEKAGLLPLVQSRFGWLDCTSLRGFTSLTHARSVGRYDLVVYAGDYDPSGLDIERDLAARAGVLVDRVALTWQQVTDHDLPPDVAKSTDSRTARMLAVQGHAVQVEVDALPPAVLLGALTVAVAEATGLDVDESTGWPVLPEVDEAEQTARDRIAGEVA